MAFTPSMNALDTHEIPVKLLSLFLSGLEPCVDKGRLWPSDCLTRFMEIHFLGIEFSPLSIILYLFLSYSYTGT